jgi:hypothetical protein
MARQLATNIEIVIRMVVLLLGKYIDAKAVPRRSGLPDYQARQGFSRRIEDPLVGLPTGLIKIKKEGM